MIKYQKGNVLKATTEVIAHQTNCLGIMGGGVALQIQEKYPEVFDAYETFCAGKDRSLLGKMQLCAIGRKKYIANLFGQYDCGEGMQTDYKALEKAMKLLCEEMNEMGLKSVAFPDMIGCGLAGGDREVVLEMIERIFADFKVEIWAYR